MNGCYTILAINGIGTPEYTADSVSDPITSCILCADSITTTTTTAAPTTTTTTIAPEPATTTTTTTRATSETTTTTTADPYTFNVTANDSSAYIINGQSNPTLSLIAGQTYTFNIAAPGHPFFIKTINSTGTGNQYTDGVTNNGEDNGQIVFVVGSIETTPNPLYYNCKFHSSMAGIIGIGE